VVFVEIMLQKGDRLDVKRLFSFLVGVFFGKKQNGIYNILKSTGQIFMGNWKNIKNGLSPGSFI